MQTLLHMLKSASIDIETIDGLAARIPNDASLIVAPDYSGCAMGVIRALIRRGIRRLHLIGAPQIGFQGDILIGADCISILEAAAVTLGEYGPAPRFSAAVKAGKLVLRDSTCPAIHAGLQAAEKGIPFMPLRGILGSDLLTYRDDWQVINNPYSKRDSDPIVLLPAIRPDVALFHSKLADRSGNVWVGVRRELMLMAHAARMTLVSVEEFTDDDLLANDRTAAGTIPALYIYRHSPKHASARGQWVCEIAIHRMQITCADTAKWRLPTTGFVAISALMLRRSA